MNIVIPQNLKEAQQFVNQVQKLNDDQLYELIQLYKKQGYKFDIFNDEVDGRIFSISKNNEIVEFDLENITWRNKFGEVHRENGPSVERADGGKFWSQNGEYHRTDGPACEWPAGKKEWYQNGKRHRSDGPAVEWPNGDKEWWLNGKRHRTDGPAIEWLNGNKVWYIHGEPILSFAKRFVRGSSFDIQNEMRNINAVLEKVGMRSRSKNEIRSLIEFLWQNGYQFDEYLNDYENVKPSENLLNFDMSRISLDNEKKVMNALRSFYIADRVSQILKRLSEFEEEDVSEIMINAELMLKRPTVEEIFKNWKTYDELSEAMSIKKYWTYI